MPSRLSTLGLAAAVTAALLATTACDPADETSTGEDAKTTSETESYDVPGEIKKIDLRGHTGAVEVVAADSGIRVTERREYSRSAPRTSHRTDAGVLYLLDEGCDKKSRVWKTCDTSYKIEAPAGVSLKIEVDASPVTITGITGSIDIASDVSAIKGTGLAGDTRVRTNAGDIDLRYGAAPASLDATSDVGQTTIYLPSGEKYRFDVEVDTGATAIDLPNNADATHRIKLATNAGDIAVRAA